MPIRFNTSNSLLYLVVCMGILQLLSHPGFIFNYRSLLGAGVRRWLMWQKIHRKDLKLYLTFASVQMQLLNKLIIWYSLHNIGQVSFCSISSAYTCNSVPDEALQVGCDWRDSKAWSHWGLPQGNGVDPNHCR